MNQGHLITKTREQITPLAATGGRQVPAGTVLLSFKLSIGKVSIAGIPLFTNEAIAALQIRDHGRVDARYLLRALEGMNLAADSNRAAMGATLNKAQLQAIPIPLPLVSEQRRIAAILDQADALRAKRRQVLAHLDALNQSIFHDMFGDLVHGNWQVEPLGLLSPRIDSGTSPVCETRAALPGEWGVLKLGAVTYGEFRGSENKAYLGDVTSMLGNEVKPGDVLMTRKNTQDLVGAVAVVEDHVISGLLIPDLVFRLHLDRERLDAEYLRTTTADALYGQVAGMNLDNVLVRPHRRAVERFGVRDAWEALSSEDLVGLQALAGLPTLLLDDDELAKRFDLLVMRRQLAQVNGDMYEAERLREAIQGIAAALLGKGNIPSVAAASVLIEAVAGDEWWVDVTLPMLEVMRVRLRGLVRFVDAVRRAPVYTDFEDELGDAVEVALPGRTPGTDIERFRSKAAVYLREHDDNVALQRLRRNRQLTPDDLSALEQMLLASGAGVKTDVDRVAAQNGGLGLFIRSLVGLDRVAATEAFAAFLDQTRFAVEQIRFVQLIIDELTANGVMDPSRLYESPYIDHGHLDVIFPHEVGTIVKILRDVKAHALSADVA